jgi:hypothetical protein
MNCDHLYSLAGQCTNLPEAAGPCTYTVDFQSNRHPLWPVTRLANLKFHQVGLWPVTKSGIHHLNTYFPQIEHNGKNSCFTFAGIAWPRKKFEGSGANFSIFVTRLGKIRYSCMWFVTTVTFCRFLKACDLWPVNWMKVYSMPEAPGLSTTSQEAANPMRKCLDQVEHSWSVHGTVYSVEDWPWSRFIWRGPDLEVFVDGWPEVTGQSGEFFKLWSQKTVKNWRTYTRKFKNSPAAR